jgi:hypothetical protein
MGKGRPWGKKITKAESKATVKAQGHTHLIRGAGQRPQGGGEGRGPKGDE